MKNRILISSISFSSRASSEDVFKPNIFLSLIRTLFTFLFLSHVLCPSRLISLVCFSFAGQWLCIRTYSLHCDVLFVSPCLYVSTRCEPFLFLSMRFPLSPSVFLLSLSLLFSPRLAVYPDWIITSIKRLSSLSNCLDHHLLLLGFCCMHHVFLLILHCSPKASILCMSHLYISVPEYKCCCK